MMMSATSGVANVKSAFAHIAMPERFRIINASPSSGSRCYGAIRCSIASHCLDRSFRRSPLSAALARKSGSSIWHHDLRAARSIFCSRKKRQIYLSDTSTTSRDSSGAVQRP